MAKKSSPVDAMVGQRLKAKRQALGLSRETLAEQVNLSNEALGEYEAGLKRLRAGTLLEIARVLNVPPQYFFKVATRRLEKIRSSPCQGSPNPVKPSRPSRNA